MLTVREQRRYALEIKAEQGDAEAQGEIALLNLQEGKLEEAVDFLEKASKQGNSKAQFYLGDLYLKGIVVEQDFEKAEELFRKAYKNNNLACEYYVKIFDRLNGRKIKVIRDMSEEVDEGAGAVLIVPKENNYGLSHTLYDIETYRKIKNRINEILEGIEEVKKDKSNEFDVFMKIYTKLGQLMNYDNKAIRVGKNTSKLFTSRNLVAGLLEGMCVCCRICRDIKKCACM